MIKNEMRANFSTRYFDDFFYEKILSMEIYEAFREIRSLFINKETGVTSNDFMSFRKVVELNFAIKSGRDVKIEVRRRRGYKTVAFVY